MRYKLKPRPTITRKAEFDPALGCYKAPLSKGGHFLIDEAGKLFGKFAYINVIPDWAGVC